MRVSKKQLFFNWLIALSSCFIFLAFAEISFRLRHLFVRGIPLFATLEAYQEQEFGWQGRKLFGQQETNRPKILVIGDSFTEGLGLPEEELYATKLGKALGAEMFIYAGRGYGTMQELLVLRRFLNEVQPDLIILQLCSNDFLNNSFELERRSYYQNALMMRPYLEEGKIIYRYPSQFGVLRITLAKHSRLFHFIFTKLDLVFLSLARRGVLQSVEDTIAERNGELPLFHDAVLVTDDLLSKFIAEAGAVPVIAFLADDVQPYLHEFVTIFKKLESELITDLPFELSKQVTAGEHIRLEDKVHWNSRGHELVSEILAKKIKLNKAFKAVLYGDTSVVASAAKQSHSY